MSTTLSPEALHALETLEDRLRIILTSRYLSIAGFVVLVYDILLTLDREISLVWRARLSLVKCLYFLVRYGSLLFLLFPIYHMWPFRPAFSVGACHASILVAVIGNLICLAAANSLLIMRVGALYHGNKKVTIPLYIIWAIAYILGAVFIALTSVNSLPSVTFSPVVNLCVAEHKFDAMVVPFAGPLVLEVITLALTLYKAIHTKNHVNATEGPSRLLFVVLRDGLVYYLIMLLLRLWNVYVFAALPITYFYLGAYNMWALVATLMARLFLNLRDAANIQNWRAKTPVEQQHSSSAFVNSYPRAFSHGGDKSQYENFVMELPIRSPVSRSPSSPLSTDKIGIHWN